VGLSPARTTTPGEDRDFSCISKAFASATSLLVIAAEPNTRWAGTWQDSQFTAQGAVPMGNGI